MYEELGENDAKNLKYGVQTSERGKMRSERQKC